ncbi:MAG: hypothetical protein ABSE16_05735 [Verrucomicrobiota bacterium]|jgi:tetratricopeptide (TPR) repeat protein
MSLHLHTAAEIIPLAIVVGVGIWLFIRTLDRSDERRKLIFKWVFTAAVIWFVFAMLLPSHREGGFNPLGTFVLILVCAIAMTVTWRHSILDIIAKPFSGLYDGGNLAPEPKPFYSVALSKRALGRPVEAIAEVRSQLARFPNDYQGVMLLACIQAEDMQDLPGAEITLDHFCAAAGAPPKQVAAVRNQVADWHLKFHQDADAARAALEKIIERYPETDLALQAAQRIAHLGGTGKILLEARDRQPMALPEGVKSVGLLASTEFLRPEETDPGQQAATYVKHLEQHPLDSEIREKLAVIYADHFHRLDMATMELRQLIEYPGQPARQVAHWLNLLADLQIRHGAAFDTVRHTLEIIRDQFPKSAVASVAQTRLAHLKLEIKAHQETPDVRLGTYEQNLGLKHGPPRPW